MITFWDDYFCRKRREPSKNVVAIPCFVLSWKQEEKNTDRMFTLLVKVKQAKVTNMQVCVLSCDLSSQCLQHAAVWQCRLFLTVVFCWSQISQWAVLNMVSMGLSKLLIRLGSTIQCTFLEAGCGRCIEVLSFLALYYVLYMLH